MTHYQQLIKQINNSEAAGELFLQECNKLKELLGGVYPSTPRKGKYLEDAKKITAVGIKRRQILKSQVIGNKSN